MSRMWWARGRSALIRRRRHVLVLMALAGGALWMIVQAWQATRRDGQTFRGDLYLNIGAALIMTLLTYLVLKRSAPQPRRRLAFLLWPDSSEAQARANLRKLLHQLQQALPGANRYLRVDTQTIQWRAEASFTLDVGDFEQALERAAAAAYSDEPAAERPALELAVRVYRGELLPSCYDEWLMPERERLVQCAPHHQPSRVSTVFSHPDRVYQLLERRERRRRRSCGEGISQDSGVVRQVTLDRVAPGRFQPGGIASAGARRRAERCIGFLPQRVCDARPHVVGHVLKGFEGR